MKTLLIMGISATLLTSVSAFAQNDVADSFEPAEQRHEQERTVTLIVEHDNASDYPWTKVRVPSSQVDAKTNELLRDPSVISVERAPEISRPKPPTVDARASVMPMMASGSAVPTFNDPGFPDQRIYQNINGHDMRLLEAAERVDDANAMRIGVLDSGFSRIQDVTYETGYNFAGDAPIGPAFLLEDIAYCSDQEASAGSTLFYRHGTVVSAVATASANNYSGIAGVSQNATVVAGRVMDCSGYGQLDAIADGILWQIGAGVPSAPGAPVIDPVDVINISISSTAPECPSYLQSAVDAATQKGIPIVVAAGNDSYRADRGIAMCDGVITVAATTHDGDLASFTNTGPNVDIAATGETIRAVTVNDRLTYASGTSFASPIMAAVIANTQKRVDNASPADIIDALTRSGTPANNNATGFGLGGGIIDAMILMDEMGVPRDIVAAVNGLSGEREQYKQALIHPSAQAFLGSKNPCDMVEVDARTMPNADKSQAVSVFRVAKGTPLLPQNGNIIDSVSGQERFFTDAITTSEASAYDYGVAQCDIATGADCSQKDSIRGIDSESLIASTDCSI
ncbi:MAG: peptidase S8/S53 subtilisin kexin sedolisin [Marinobacter sp. T13-3]|nr:MAG: peptidase S8/S53 subtilisin kexin sedolisin [Marinobacter sp. T13-3]